MNRSVSLLDRSVNVNPIAALELLFNHSVDKKNKKILKKRQTFLLQYPLFTTIYQKKGQQNFANICQNITLKIYDFGEPLIVDKENRCFNYIVKGVVMLFSAKKNDPKQTPQFYKKLSVNQYFGQTMHINSNQQLHSAKSISKSWILQMDFDSFFQGFSGHFKYPELKEKIDALSNVWAFKQIKNSSLERILLLSKFITVPRNKIIFKEGETPQFLYVVFQGQLALYTTYSDNTKRPFCVLSKDQVVGLAQITHQENYQYGSVSTLQNTILLSIPEKLVKELVCPYVKEQWCENKFKFQKQLLKLKREVPPLKQTQEISKTKVVTSDRLQRYSSWINEFQVVENRLKSEGNRFQRISLFKNTEASKVIILKDKNLRQYKLNQISKELKSKMHETRLSLYGNSMNKEMTYDKNILFNYIVRKEKNSKKSIDRELKFQMTAIKFTNQFKPSPCVAVKNFKRKIRKSFRNQNYKSLDELHLI